MPFDSCCFVKCTLIAQAVTRSLQKIYTLMNDSGQASTANEWGEGLFYGFYTVLYISLCGMTHVTA